MEEPYITEEKDWKQVISNHGLLLVEIQETLKRMEETNEPIVRAYQTATTLGKWLMGFAVFASIIIGSVLGLKDLFHR